MKAQSSAVDVLLVDDRPENLLALESLLENSELNLIKASSGMEALALLLRHDVALVLLDVQMPEMDGFETAELMRSRPKTRHIPIIFVTAISKEQGHVFKGYESGAVDYLFKPIDPLILKCKVKIFVDLFRQKRALEEASREFEQLNRELERLVEEKTRDVHFKAQELERANQRLVELDMMKSAFLSSVSHELRTPLTSIMGFAKLINKEFTNTIWPMVKGTERIEKKCRRIHENLTVIGNEGERLTRLINDVLDLNKIESGLVVWRDRDISMAESINQAVKAVSGEFENKPDVALLVDVAPDLPQVRMDLDKLQQVLINLLNNAAKFTPEGSVTVRGLLTPSGSIQVRVEDTGEGIPLEHQEQIFERFQQIGGETLSNKPKGTGLGLAICREIVSHYHGNIWVESEPGKGSHFVFELPCLNTKAERTPVVELQGDSSRPLVLVVEDDPALNAYISQSLAGEGFRVLSALDGASGIELAARHKPDCITMDILLPDIDGRQAIEVLRKIPELANTSILVVSAYPQGAVAGGDAYLRKPVDQLQLIKGVHELLQVKRRFS